MTRRLWGAALLGLLWLGPAWCQPAADPAPFAKPPASYANETECWSDCSNEDSRRVMACMAATRADCRYPSAEIKDVCEKGGIWIDQHCMDKTGFNVPACQRACAERFASKPKGWENIRKVSGATPQMERYGRGFLLLCVAVMVVGTFKIFWGKPKELVASLIAIFGIFRFANYMHRVALEDRATHAKGNWSQVLGQVLDPGQGWSGPELRYRYQVDGVVYEGHRVRPFGQESEQLGPAVNRYKPGAAVTVYYAPDDPGESVLEPGVSRGY